MYIDSSEALKRAKTANWPMTVEGEHSILEAPGGYKFFIADKPQPKDTGTQYYHGILCSNIYKFSSPHRKYR